MKPLSRRSILRAAGIGSLGAGLASTLPAGRTYGEGERTAAGHDGHGAHSGHKDLGVVGAIDKSIFDPNRYLRAWNFSDLPEEERARFYRETPRPDGSLLREYEIFAVDREIEIAPGVFFPAWTYNGQVPGPTIRATEGDRVRIRFVNQGSAPAHAALPRLASAGDGRLACPDQQVAPGERVPLRVRRRARSACTSTTATPCR